MPNHPDPGSGPPSPDPRPPARKPTPGSSPHDALFRKILGVPENMASQLRTVLPPGVAARIDLSRLQRAPGSFVDQELKWRHTDLLFTAPLDGHDAFVYLLAEHQSSDDQWMPLRLMRYVIRIWDHYLEEHKEARRLPAVIPLVVHHGRSQWTSPMQLLELIDLDPAAREAMGAYLPRLEFLLEDLAAIDTDQLRDQDLTPQTRVTKVLLKITPGNPRLAEELRKWENHLADVLDGPGGFEAFTTFLEYIWQVSEIPVTEFSDLVNDLGRDAKEAYMTTAEMIEARGEAIGRAKSLVEVLTVKFGTLPEDVTEKIQEASSSQIQEWTIRSVTAVKLDEVFA